jgi:hypothetical protein
VKQSGYTAVMFREMSVKSFHKDQE